MQGRSRLDRELRDAEAIAGPSLPADLAGSVLVPRELYDLSDAQAADALKFDIRWKVACGRSLTQLSFDPGGAGVLAAADCRLEAAGPGA